MYSFALLALLPTVARADGVIIGHPAEFHFAPGAGITWTSGSISVATENVELCDATVRHVVIDDVLDIGDPIWLPNGVAVCGVSLDLDGPTLLEGVGTAGGTVSMSLPMSVIQIPLGTGLTFASTDTIALELASPDWTTATALALATGITRNLDQTSNNYQALKSALRNDSSLQVE